MSIKESFYLIGGLIVLVAFMAIINHCCPTQP